VLHTLVIHSTGGAWNKTDVSINAPKLHAVHLTDIFLSYNSTVMTDLSVSSNTFSNPKFCIHPSHFLAALSSLRNTLSSLELINSSPLLPATPDPIDLPKLNHVTITESFHSLDSIRQLPKALKFSKTATVTIRINLADAKVDQYRLFLPFVGEVAESALRILPFVLDGVAIREARNELIVEVYSCSNPFGLSIPGRRPGHDPLSWDVPRLLVAFEFGSSTTRFWALGLLAKTFPRTRILSFTCDEVLLNPEALLRHFPNVHNFHIVDPYALGANILDVLCHSSSDQYMIQQMLPLPFLKHMCLVHGSNKPLYAKLLKRIAERGVTQCMHPHGKE